MFTGKNVFVPAKGDFYDIQPINDLGCNWNIIMGMRGPGKSYQFGKIAIDNFIDNNKQFGIVRRYAEEIKMASVNTWFDHLNDYLIYKVRFVKPDADRAFIYAKGGAFRLKVVTDDEDGEPVVEDWGVIGYYFALSQATQKKSNQYPDVTLFCYEEFITSDSELPNEYTKFMNLVSTIKRKRSDFKVYMLANTVDRHSTILNSMGIDPRDLKPGDLKVYEFSNSKGITNRVAVEFTRTYAQSEESESYFVFDNKKEQIITESGWELDSAYNTCNIVPVNRIRSDYCFILRSEFIKQYYYFDFKYENIYVFDHRLPEIRTNEFIMIDCSELAVTKLDRKIYSSKSNFGQNTLKFIMNYKNNGHLIFQDSYTGNDCDRLLKLF